MFILSQQKYVSCEKVNLKTQKVIVLDQKLQFILLQLFQFILFSTVINKYDIH